MSEDDRRDELERGVTPDEARKAAPRSAEEVEQHVPPPELRVTKEHSNLDQTLIEVTGDRAKLVLMEVADRLARRREWPGPFGLFVGLILSVLTADYKKRFGIPAATIRGIVIAFAFIAAVWTVVTVVRALRTPSREQAVEDALDALKYRGSA